MRISRKKFRTFFAIFVSRPTPPPGAFPDKRKSLLDIQMQETLWRIN